MAKSADGNPGMQADLSGDEHCSTLFGLLFADGQSQGSDFDRPKAKESDALRASL